MFGPQLVGKYLVKTQRQGVELSARFGSSAPLYLSAYYVSASSYVADFSSAVQRQLLSKTRLAVAARVSVSCPCAAPTHIGPEKIVKILSAEFFEVLIQLV